MNLLQDRLTTFYKSPAVKVVERDVLRIAGKISLSPESNSFDIARTEILSWVKNRVGAELPDHAWNLEDFRTDVAGRNTECYYQEFDDVDIWALRTEDPDSNVPGRNWKTEIVLARVQASSIRFSLRLRVSSDALDYGFDPPPLNWSGPIVRNRRIKDGNQTTQA